MKRCVFHYLQPIEDKPGIGSALRPNKMLHAFEAIGYQVDEVTGSSSERVEKILQIKQNIENGICYDFVYSESVNSPTILSDYDHIPRHPFADFMFFKFCRQKGIPVGLFYRDVHWKFPVYKSVSLWKRLLLIPLFRYDLHMYHKVLDILYLPSKRMEEVVLGYNSIPLPPGGVLQTEQLANRCEKRQQSDRLRVFYVGNVMGVYNVQKLCMAVKETANVELTICTPESSWNQVSQTYKPYLCDRIRIVHKSSHELKPYFEETDIFACCLETNEYIQLAMPIKVAESIGYGVPVLITSGIAAADFINTEGCGWVVDYTVDAIKNKFQNLLDDPQEVDIATKNAVVAAPRHTWEMRAQQVANDLKELRKEI